MVTFTLLSSLSKCQSNCQSPLPLSARQSSWALDLPDRVGLGVWYWDLEMMLPAILVSPPVTGVARRFGPTDRWYARVWTEAGMDLGR